MYLNVYALIENLTYSRERLSDVRYRYAHTKCRFRSARFTRHTHTTRDPSTTKRSEDSEEARTERMRADTGRACGPRRGDTRPSVVPLRHEFRVDPSYFVLLPVVLAARVRGHLYTLWSPLLLPPCTRIYVRIYSRHTSLLLLLLLVLFLLFLPSAFKAVRVLRYARNITRFFLEAHCDE